MTVLSRFSISGEDELDVEFAAKFGHGVLIILEAPKSKIENIEGDIFGFQMSVDPCSVVALYEWLGHVIRMNEVKARVDSKTDD